MLCGPLALVAFVALTSVMSVEDPRPAHHVVDHTGTLTAEDIAEIDKAAERAAAQGELVVVVVPSTDGANPRQWATAYFNTLRLDTKDRNRGIVLMAAITDRKAEIVVGDGFPASVTADTDTIMASVVVAHFKRGDPRGALVQGAKQLADHVIASAATTSGPASTDTNATALLAHDAPVVPPDVVTAAAHELVTSIADARAGALLIDSADAFTPDYEKWIASAQDMMTADMSLIIVTVASTEPLERSLFAQALAHRMGLNDSKARTGRDILVVAVTGKPNKAVKGKTKGKPPPPSKGKATKGSAKPTIDIIAGAALPSHLRDLTSVANQWRASVDSGKGVARATKDAADSLKMVPMDVMMFEAEREAVERAAREERHRVWRAQLAAQQAAAQQTSNDDGAFFDDDNPLAWGTGGAGLFGLFLAGREVARRRPRSCKKCNLRMHRLAEELDDKHLQDGEKAEERLGSVDYDVWACGQCGDVLKTRWGALFTSYSRCSSCSWKTMKSTSRTISAATTSSTGLAEVTDDCKHCSHHRTYTRVIPRVTKSSSSGSSSRGGGGGGFSSGRGSSGSW